MIDFKNPIHEPINNLTKDAGNIITVRLISSKNKTMNKKELQHRIRVLETRFDEKLNELETHKDAVKDGFESEIASLKKNLEELPQENEETEYRTGMRFMDSWNDEYILAYFTLDEEEKFIYVVLINLDNGNRFSDPIIVNDMNKITKQEANKIGIFRMNKQWQKEKGWVPNIL